MDGWMENRTYTCMHFYTIPLKRNKEGSVWNIEPQSMKSPIQKTEESVKTGKELYEIYCSVCHGEKGDGMGILAQREKFLGIPAYIDREITPGSIYHVLMYGINAMGSHSGQVNEEERWQIAQYVMKLREESKK